MCGIFSIFNVVYTRTSDNFVQTQFAKGSSRGPEYSELKYMHSNYYIGFHRLAINGLQSNSNQPFIFNDIALICNGEIYNYKQLYQLIDVSPTTDSDCEIIIHLYLKYGINQTIKMLDGEFSFILIDASLKNKETKAYIAREPYGVRPLYFFKK